MLLRRTPTDQVLAANWEASLGWQANRKIIFLDLFLFFCFLHAPDWIPDEAVRALIPLLAHFTTSSQLSVRVNRRIDHQSRAVPLQSAHCLISARQSQRINKSITEGFCIQERGKEIQNKQINVPALYEEFWVV